MAILSNPFRTSLKQTLIHAHSTFTFSQLSPLNKRWTIPIRGRPNQPTPPSTPIFSTSATQTDALKCAFPQSTTKKMRALLRILKQCYLFQSVWGVWTQTRNPNSCENVFVPRRQTPPLCKGCRRLMSAACVREMFVCR